MATIDQLVSRMKVRMSRHQDSGLDAKIIFELQAAQEMLEQGITLPWFLNTLGDVTVDIAHELLPLGLFTDYIRIADDDFGLRVLDSSRSEPYVKLTRVPTYERLLDFSTGPGDAFPEGYFILGSNLLVRGKQSVGRTYRMSYFRKDPTPPDAGKTTLWSANAPNLLLAQAGIEVARYLRDGESLKYFLGLHSKTYGDMVKRNQALQDADASYVMDE